MRFVLITIIDSNFYRRLDARQKFQTYYYNRCQKGSACKSAFRVVGHSLINLYNTYLLAWLQYIEGLIYEPGKDGTTVTFVFPSATGLLMSFPIRLDCILL